MAKHSGFPNTSASIAGLIIISFIVAGICIAIDNTVSVCIPDKTTGLIVRFAALPFTYFGWSTLLSAFFRITEAETAVKIQGRSGTTSRMTFCSTSKS